MNPSFMVYIDEAGDEGFAFKKGSSEWFILAAAVTRRANDLETVKLVDKVREQLRKAHKKPLHFRDLKHNQRLPFVDEISKARLRSVSVLVHKPSIKEPERFKESSRLYFYAVRLLLERVSWFCRDHHTLTYTGDGSAKIIFSNRSTMSYDDLKKYLELLKESSELDVNIDWSAINCDQMTAAPAASLMGLQIVDAIAGSFYYAVTKAIGGFTEDRYVRMLHPIVYHRKGTHKGYGIKVWPREGFCLKSLASAPKVGQN